MANAREIELHDAQAEEYDIHAARGIGYAVGARKLLKEIDSRLDVIWAKEGSTSLQGGRWYIVRNNDDAPPTYWCVQNPDGSYADIGPEHVERMKAIDAAAHPGLYKRFRDAETKRRLANKKTSEDKHREFREKLEERIASMMDASIFVTPQMKARADGLLTTEGGVVLPAVEMSKEALQAPVARSVETGLDAHPGVAKPEGIAEAIQRVQDKNEAQRALAGAEADEPPDDGGPACPAS
jgi:hypothetical protein